MAEGTVTPCPGHVRLKLETPAGRYMYVGPFATLGGARRLAEDLIGGGAVRSALVQHRNRGTWRPAWGWLASALMLVLVFAGCATPGTLASVPLSDTQADLVERWQGFADRVLDSYHLTHVRIIVQHRPDTEGMMATSLRSRIIIIDPRALYPRMLPGLAHELGHVVSGQGPDPAHQEENERDANFRAVAILVIGQHTSEEAAFHQMRDLLAAIATVRAKLGSRAPAYHNACAEVFDLDRHFPQYPCLLCRRVRRRDETPSRFYLRHPRRGGFHQAGGLPPVSAARPSNSSDSQQLDRVNRLRGSCPGP